MSDFLKDDFKLPPEQQAIRDKCFHPSGRFIEFPHEDIEMSIPARFEKIVNKFADRVAIKANNCCLTYNALNQTANRIARAVLQRCQQPEQPIVLLLEKDWPAIATILGILKAGKMYLVLDPSFPRERLASMLYDSQARLIVTDSENSSLAEGLAADKRQLLRIDHLEPNLSNENLGLAILPTAFAYVRYTSGSTGEPKGIVENHLNMLHNVANITNSLHLCSDDRATLLGSLSGGQASTDMYAALLNGAALFIWDSGKAGLASLPQWLISEAITYYRSSATTFRCFVEALCPGSRFPSLRLVRLASEPVLRKDFDSYQKYFSENCIMVNALSLGEARTICLNLLDKSTSVSGNIVPVGYALPGKEIILVDDIGREVPSGEIGEITVKSHYLSPGYWDRPELTSEKFLPSPEDSSKRIYRTGDLGRVLPDGCLVYIGRKDFQVKVRGFRVEVAETEAALANHPSIKEVIVMGFEDPAAGTRIACFYVPVVKPGPSATELRRYLAEKLPDYMIPSDFLPLEALQLTPNGKIDRSALPEWTNERPNLTTPFVEPRTTVERELALIWSEILSLREIGINDNFFDLGGNSLAAMRVLSRVMKQFQLDIPLHSLFQSPTVAAMVSIVVQYQTARVSDAKLAQMLRELEAMTEEEVQRQLVKESRQD